jgi:hypothetical protein
MNLTEEPEIVTWPETHYAFVEKIGPFQTTAGQAWQSARALVPAISVHNQITGGMSLYKVGPKIYRAGFSLAAPPVELPEGLEYAKFSGGKYSRFALTGPMLICPKHPAGSLRLSPKNRSNSGMTSALRTTRTIREQRLKSS